MPIESCLVCDHEWGCLFSCLEGEALETFRRGSSFRSYRRGQLIHFQGDEPTFIFCIQSGSVKLFKTDEYNHEVVTRVLGKCEFVGIQPIFAGELIGTSAEALETSELCILPKAVFLQILELAPQLQAEMLRHTAKEWRKSEDLWLASATFTAEERVQAVLAQLATPYSGYPKGRTGTITVTIPRVEIARAANVTPSTLSRILGSFEDRGMVKLHPRTIDIIHVNGRLRT